jgi:peptide/nickel transport system permease protein
MALPEPRVATGRGEQSAVAVRLIRLARRRPLGAVGAVIVLFLAAISIFGSAIAPFDPLAIDSRLLFAAPGSAGHVLGTDDLGRDVLSRLLVATRSTLLIAVFGVVIGSAIGAFAGLLSGYKGGWLEALLQRLTDVLMAFPTLILALSIAAILGRSERNVILAIAIVQLPLASRVIRAAVLPLRHAEFVTAARSVGVPEPLLLLRHIAPQVVSPYLIALTASISTGILIESSLSFLGVGTPEPAPSWGAMLSGPTLQNVERAPWNAVFPGLAVSLAVFGFNLLGDAVRDVLDPRRRV